MLKVLVFLTKREGIETQAFIDYYEKIHVPLICGLAPAPTVYKRNYLVPGDVFSNKTDSAIGFDVVTELVFPDRATFTVWVAKLTEPGIGEQRVADELNFLDPSRTRAYVVEECVTPG